MSKNEKFLLALVLFGGLALYYSFRVTMFPVGAHSTLTLDTSAEADIAVDIHALADEGQRSIQSLLKGRRETLSHYPSIVKLKGGYSTLLGFFLEEELAWEMFSSSDLRLDGEGKSCHALEKDNSPTVEQILINPLLMATVILQVSDETDFHSLPAQYSDFTYSGKEKQARITAAIPFSICSDQNPAVSLKLFMANARDFGFQTARVSYASANSQDNSVVVPPTRIPHQVGAVSRKGVRLNGLLSVTPELDRLPIPNLPTTISIDLWEERKVDATWPPDFVFEVVLRELDY